MAAVLKRKKKEERKQLEVVLPVAPLVPAAGMRVAGCLPMHTERLKASMWHGFEMTKDRA